MKLLYFKGDPPNFGDELNPYVFDSLLDKIDFARQSRNYYLMGIGSILSKPYFARIKPHEKAVVFGSGIRDPQIVAPIDKLSIEFARGPISAQALQCQYITDAAYLLVLLKDYQKLLRAPKKFRISLMPYFRHVDDLDWETISVKSGVHIIMPTWPVYKILQHIAQSENIIAGAMHGCIVADIFRIPWARLQFDMHEAEKIVQSVKWMDWCASITVSQHKRFAVASTNKKNKLVNAELNEEILDILTTKLCLEDFSLSGTERFNEITAQLRDALFRFSEKFHIRLNQDRMTCL